MLVGTGGGAASETVWITVGPGTVSLSVSVCSSVSVIV